MKPTLSQRIRYRFDNLMAHGTPAMIAMLLVLSMVIVFTGGIIVSLIPIMPANETSPLEFGEAAWLSLMRAMDSGAMGGDTGTGFRAVMLFVTLGGIFIVSALIGVLNNAIENQMERLRKGRSTVLESGHTLVLGWSAQVFTILNELMIANENTDAARIVILAEKDKMDMEDEIRERVQHKGKTRIICRSGNPFDPNDLEITSPHAAKSIIVLPPENDDPDIDVIKTVLAITNNPRRRAQPYHIITQIRNTRNAAVLRLVGEKDNVQAIVTGDLIARVMAQTSRQSGLSVVYTELMNFDGDEMYFKHEPALCGKSFGDALLAYEDSCLMGIRKATGKIILNPPMNTLIEKDDQLVALSADDDTIRLSSLAQVPVSLAAIRAHKRASQLQPEKCLILGWNRSGPTIVQELDNYVAKGSQVRVVADVEGFKDQLGALEEKLRNQTLFAQEGQTTDRELLNALNVADYDHVIVLAYNSTVAPQEADARTLVTLLHLRDMAQKDETPFSIVSEMLDLRNRELAEVTKVDDFIVSDHMVSLMMSQISENSELFGIFAEILDPAGAEIHLKPVTDYVTTGEPVNFYTVVEAARQRGETAIGYRLTSESSQAAKSYGIHTNPKKSDKVFFTPTDKIIVIAQD